MYPAKVESIRWIKKRREIILLDPGKGKYHRLNETASLIWEYSDGTRDEEYIADIIKARYSAHGNSVTEDVKRTLLYLRKMGLILLKNASYAK